MIELEVQTILINNDSNESYTLILKEVNGDRRIPIVIGAYEAQSISHVLNETNVFRPMTHDLFANFIKEVVARILKVEIVFYSKGLFSSNLFCRDILGKEFTLDARTSDAVAIALRTKAKIYCSQEVMDKVNVNLDDDDNISKEEYKPNLLLGEDITIMTKEELEINMQIAIAREDYTLASKYRDERNKRFRYDLEE